jgi:hypothetical protein
MDRFVTGFPDLRKTVEVPALPGAQANSVTCGEAASFQTSACSRPPDPMTRTFIFGVSQTATESVRKRDLARKIRYRV